MKDWLILLFGVTIYLEINILNFCNFDENTEKNIIQRAKEKSLKIEEQIISGSNESIGFSFKNTG